MRIYFLALILFFALNLFAQQPPNIIWLMAEDISNDLACYGTKGVQTPNLDRLAEQGNRYLNCYSTNPICSPNRSAMMVGVHQNLTNSQHHRSNRNKPLAEPYKPITYWLREAGYTCILGHEKVMDKGRKIDCNFKTKAIGPYDGITNFGLFDKVDRFEVADQPFFAQIQLKVTHRGDWWEEISRQSADRVKPEEVELPPFMADHPVIREDWARYLDQIEYMDAEVGMIMQELEEKGMADNTIIIFIGDNGRCNIRGKGYLHDPGLRVPLIVHWPGKLKAGQVKDDIISVTDISASILQIADAELPDYLTGIPFIETSSNRQAVYSARDLWDEVMEKSRSITTKRYKYIRNDMPWVPFDAHQGYLEFYRPAVHIMRQLKVNKKLNPGEAFFFKAQKPREELYDLINDPYELNNLADDPPYQAALVKFRADVSKWEDDLPNLSMDDFDLVVPAAVELLDWVRYEKPALYLEMLEGKEIGFQKLNKAYRKR